MKYKILYSKSAKVDIDKLDPVAKKRLKKKIEQFITDPIVYGRKLMNAKLGSYRWRAGNHRIVFDIRGRTVYVLRVGHRKEIYKR